MMKGKIKALKSDKKRKKKGITSPRKLDKHQKQKETEEVVFTEDDGIVMTETEGMATDFLSEEDSWIRKNPSSPWYHQLQIGERQ